MSEEELAAALGLSQTWRMRVMRRVVIWLAPPSAGTRSRPYVRALGYYQKLGEHIVDAKPATDVHIRMSAQIGLILCSASIRRDLARRRPSYIDGWEEDLNDAMLYALNADPLVTNVDVIAEIERLIANGP